MVKSKELLYGTAGFIGGAILGSVAGGALGFFGSEGSYYVSHQTFAPITDPYILTITGVLAGVYGLSIGLVGGYFGVDAASRVKPTRNRTRSSRVS